MASDRHSAHKGPFIATSSSSLSRFITVLSREGLHELLDLGQQAAPTTNLLTGGSRPLGYSYLEWLWAPSAPGKAVCRMQAACWLPPTRPAAVSVASCRCSMCHVSEAPGASEQSTLMRCSVYTV